MNTQHGRIAIEFISVLGLPPVPFVELASQMGCRYIGMGLQPMFAENPHGYPAWSLRNDPVLRRETIAALRDQGVSISLGEGFLAWPHKDIADSAADLDLMRELGAERVNLMSIDSDLSRTFDQCARFAELATARGLMATVEYLPGLAIGNLASAVAAVRHAANPNFRVLVDAMHFFRSGSQPAELAALDPALIGYVQLCDVPLVAKYDDYSYEARFERLAPGKGELPLFDLLAAVPQDVIVGLETPMLREAEAGVGPKERLSGGIQETRNLLARAAPTPENHRTAR
jgi:sugar phosphate isomerase/epimerase